MPEEKRLNMRKHYDICVVGLFGSRNYGSILNNWAIYRLLKYKFNRQVLMLPSPKRMEDNELVQGFCAGFFRENFDPEAIGPILTPNELYKLNPLCDCFCAGSDQIWNDYFIQFFGDSFYLHWVKSDKKMISFATSFGLRNTIPPEKKALVSLYLSRFDAISVRSEFDVDECKSLGVQASLVFEPVFLLEESAYQALAAKSQFALPEHYLLSYCLDPTPAKLSAIENCAASMGLRALVILDGYNDNIPLSMTEIPAEDILQGIPVEDFLSLFMHADCIVTDSFHGTAFSILFEKPFFAILNQLRGVERFTDLLSRLQLTDRILDLDKSPVIPESLLAPIDWGKTEELIRVNRKNALDWLENAIFDQAVAANTDKPKINVGTRLRQADCVGCSACAASCPVSAIQLKPDQWGYYRAVVDREKCVECGKCAKICPKLQPVGSGNWTKPVCYEFVSADDEILRKSSSGGVFTALAKEVFAKGGSVAGAAWRGDLSVEHTLVETEDELWKLQKSKYLQSYMGDVLSKVKTILEMGRPVLFTGTPCQVAGLRAFLGKDYDNLLAVDIFCTSAPSAGFFKSYLADSFPDGLSAYEFRHKSDKARWDCLHIQMTDKDGRFITRDGFAQDNYQRVFHNHIMCAPHCEICRFQALPRRGDISIGDFWGIEGHDLQLDTFKGISLVLCNNEKGKHWFNAIPQNSYRVKKQVPLSWIGGNGFALNGGKNWVSPYRDRFFELVQTLPFGEAVDTVLSPEITVPMEEYTGRLQVEFQVTLDVPDYNENLWTLQRDRSGLRIHSMAPDTERFICLPLSVKVKQGECYRITVNMRIKTDSDVFSVYLEPDGMENRLLILKKSVAGKNDGCDQVRVTGSFRAAVDSSRISISSFSLIGYDNEVLIEEIRISQENISDKRRLKEKLLPYGSRRRRLARDAKHKFQKFMRNK